MAGLNIQIEISALDKGASSVIGNIKSAVGGLGGLAQGALTLGLGAATAGLGALGAGIAVAVHEAMGAQEVMAQTEAVIKSTGSAAGLTAKQVADMATALSTQSRFSDDAIQKGENLLLTFTNIGKDTFPLATQAMVDMAQAMGTDVAGGAIQLGKALNDPTKGITALTRVGVTFTDAQKKLIESLQASGNMAGAQRVILDELAKEFGGSAAAAAETFGGKLDVMKNRLLNVAEAIGGPLLSVGGLLMDKFIMPAIPIVEALGNALAANLTQAISDVIAMLKNGEDPISIFSTAIGDLFGPGAAAAIDPFLTALDGVIATIQANLPAVQAALASAFGWITEHQEEIKGALIGIGAAIAAGGIISAIAGVAAAVATLLSPVGLVIAAAALLGAAWAGNWGDIQGKTAAAWAWLQPVLAQLWAWLQVNIPIALQALAGFWNTVLLPAIQGVWAWVQGSLLPTLASLAAWLQVNIPLALAALANFWQTVLLPAIQAVWSWMQGTLFPLLANLATWLSVNIPVALQALASFWTNVLQPAIAAVWTFLTTVWWPLMLQLATWLSTTLTLALQKLADFWQTVLLPAITAVWSWMSGTLFPFLNALWSFISAVFQRDLVVFSAAWNGILLPAITAVWKFFNDSILPILKTASEYLSATFGPAVNTFGGIIMGLVNGALANLKGAWDGINSAIGFVSGALSGLADIIRNLPPPPSWWKPGSPTPFERGLRGIGAAAFDLSRVRLPALAVATLALPVPTGGPRAPVAATTTVNNTTYQVEANYAYQPEWSLAQDLKLLTLARPGG